MSSHYISSHYGGSHYLSSHFGREVVVPPIVPDEPVFPPGTGAGIDGLTQRRIMEEDELLMLVIRAFLHMRNRD